MSIFPLLEDDPHHTDDPTSLGGANGVSLIDAQQTYVTAGRWTHPSCHGYVNPSTMTNATRLANVRHQ